MNKEERIQYVLDSIEDNVAVNIALSLVEECDDLQQENKQLQARIDKAIEYIKHTQSFSIVEHYMNGKNIKIPYVNGMDLLEILGESNEKNKDKR